MAVRFNPFSLRNTISYIFQPRPADPDDWVKSRMKWEVFEIVYGARTVIVGRIFTLEVKFTDVGRRYGREEHESPTQNPFNLFGRRDIESPMLSSLPDGNETINFDESTQLQMEVEASTNVNNHEQGK